MKQSIFILLFLMGFCLINAQTVNFQADKEGGCAPFVVSFTDKTTGNPIAWNWDFGDGTMPSQKQNPIKTYTNSGIYNVKLTVTFADSSKKDTTYIKYIYVSNGPTISYSIAPDSICPGGAVHFTPQINSNFGIQSHLWNFKDGNISTLSSPTHTFHKSGYYKVSLKVTDTLGCYNTDSTKNVYVKQKPKAAFAATDSIICVDNLQQQRNVSFVNQSSSDAIQFKWDFDNGHTSTQKNPSETFSYGDYDITLVVTATNGCSDTLTKKGYISINKYKVTYTVSDTIICAVPAKVTLTGTGGTAFHWTAKGPNNSHVSDGLGLEFKPTFTKEGTYYVTLAASNAFKCKDTAKITIHVYDSIPLKINIEENPHCDTNAIITFTNNTTYSSSDDFGYQSTVWNTGDGNPNQFGDTIQHRYGKNGKWYVHAYVTTPYGCTYKHLDSVEIFPVYFSWRNYLFEKNCVPFTGGAFMMEEYTSSPFVRYIWSWGDGDTTILDTTNLNSYYHTYQRTGVFPIYLTIINKQGCSYTQYIADYAVGIPPKTTYIPRDTIDTACVNDFYLYLQAGDSTYRAYDSIFVNGVYVGMDSIDKPIAGVYTNNWNWIYGETGNGEIISEYKIDTLNAKKKLDKAGPVTLRLVGKYNLCPGDTILIKDIGYICPAVARSIIRNSKFCDYPTIKFRNDSDDPTGCLWHFGNDSTSKNGIYWEGDTSSEFQPVYTYKPGKYLDKHYAEVKLWVYNDDSANNYCGYCEDSIRFRIYISHADMRLAPTTTDSVTKYEYCEGDTVMFWDSTFCTSPLLTWSLDILDSNHSTEDTLLWLIASTEDNSTGSGIFDSVKTMPKRIPHVIPWNKISWYSHGKQYKTSPFPPYTYEIDSNIAYKVETIPHPFKFHFKKRGVYYIRLNNIDMLNCGSIIDTSLWNILSTFNCNDSIFKGRSYTTRIEVFPPSKPNAIFPKDICARDSIQFFDSSYTPAPYNDFKITKHIWSCIGIKSYDKNPYYFIPNGGAYDVSYLIENEKGCDTSVIFKKALTVNSTNATWVSASGNYDACNKTLISCISKVNTFPLQSQNLKYEWHINNGQYLWNNTPAVYKGRNCICAFDVDSTQFVHITLIVTDTLTGCSSSYTDSILIRKPVADFTASEKSSICPPLQTNYQDLSYVSDSYGNTYIKKWEWMLEDYKDTTYSLQQNPQIIYNYAGKYDATLVVTDNFGCTDTNYKPDYIHIQGPHGSFESDIFTGCIPLTINFSLHVYDADSIILINGDGGNIGINIQGDTLKTIPYTYQNSGYFIASVQMIKWVTDSAGNRFKCTRTIVSADTIWAIDIKPNFTTQNLYCKGYISFTNETDSAHGNVSPIDITIDSYWDYGNGMTDSNLFHGKSYYDTAGSYTVKYTAISKSCRKEISKSITVMDFPDILIAHKDTSSCVSVKTTLEATQLSGKEKAFTWTFDDGFQYTGNPIKREYEQSGIYNYTLTVDFLPENCYKNYKDSIQIFAWIPPVAEFEIKNSKGDLLTDAFKGLDAGQTAYFNDLTQAGDAPINSWVWHIGNGDSVVVTSAPGNTTHTYNDISGYLDIILAVEDGHTCKDTIQHQLLVLENIRFPNIFSPNEDGINDVFCPIEANGFFYHLEMIIYNRWGERVWYRMCENQMGYKNICPDYNDENFWWNGKNSTGKDVSEGVYFWVLKATPLSKTQEIILNGSVTLVR